MNQKIREMAEQAGFDVYGWNEREFEKFAQLIVRECIRQCESQNTVITPATNTQHWGEISDAIEQIKQHFGVEL